MVLKKKYGQKQTPTKFSRAVLCDRKININTHSSSSSSFLLFVKYSLTHKGKNG